MARLIDSVAPEVKISSFDTQKFELYSTNGFSLQEIEAQNSDFFIFLNTVVKPAVAKWLKENKPQPSIDLDSKEFFFKLSLNQSDTFMLMYPGAAPEPSYTPPTTPAETTANEPAAPAVPRGDYSINDPDGYTNMRATPGGKIIRKVYKNETFEIVTPGDTHSEVKLADGTTGFIHNSRIAKAN